MKRLFLILIACALLISAAGCTSEESSDNLSSDPGYKWILKPGNIEGEIAEPWQDLYPLDTSVVMGLSVLENGDGESLIDYNGEIICTAENYSYFGAQNNIFFDNGGVINPLTLDEEKGAAFGSADAPHIYVYDSGDNEIYKHYFGSDTNIKDLKESVPSAMVVMPGNRVEDDENGYVQLEISLGYGIAVDKELVVECNYDNWLDYDEGGIAALCKDGKWAYFNDKGQQITNFEYDAVCDYLLGHPLQYDIEGVSAESTVPYQSSYGYIAVCKDGKFGYIDTKGNRATDLVFEDARPVCDGKAWAKTEEGWGIIELTDYSPKLGREDATDIFEANSKEQTLLGNQYNADDYYLEDNVMKYYGAEAYVFSAKDIAVSSNGIISLGFAVTFDGQVHPIVVFDQDHFSE